MIWYAPVNQVLVMSPTHAWTAAGLAPLHATARQFYQLIICQTLRVRSFNPFTHTPYISDSEEDTEDDA